MKPPAAGLRIGIDLGGTKIEGLALGPAGEEVVRKRIAAPRHDYRATLATIAGLIGELITAGADAAGSAEGGGPGSGRVTIGVGMPGSISPGAGLVQNANSVWLNGKPLDRDLAQLVGRPLRFANDANCFALSEAVDGAGAGARSVFGVILGTGVGGGLVTGGKLIDGPRAIGGEWGHNPLPRPQADEFPGPDCWCGREGCMEVWVSGPAMARDHHHVCGQSLSAIAIAANADAGDLDAQATLDRHCSRLARGLAHVINIVDPEVVVLGGGLSKLGHLYAELPARIAPHLFTDSPSVRILPPRWGDASGVRGAAWLWGQA